MKINFLIDENCNNSLTDSNILYFLFKKLKNSFDVKRVNINNFKCDKASINLFFGVVNNLLLDYAKYNILIPTPDSFKKEWVEFLPEFDAVLAKSKYIEGLFKTFVPKEKLKYIGWRSTDISSSVEKEYDEFLLFCHSKNINYKKIIENWDDSFPNLNVVNGHLFGLESKQKNIKLHLNLKQEGYEILFNRCGFHLCLSDCDFHIINQCLLSKSVPIILNCPVNEFNDDICFKVGALKKKNKMYLGSKYEIDTESFAGKIKDIVKISETTLEIMGKNGRISAIKNHGLNDVNFKKEFTDILKLVREKPINKVKTINDDELPNISLVTLAHNRKNMFKLAVYNYNTTDYPCDKIEWIIFDTSNNNEKVEGLLPDEKTRERLKIKYIHDNSQIISIGEKRNRCVNECSSNIVLFMDDDDYYYPESFRIRVEQLIHSGKKMVGCTIIGCFDISKFISYINTCPLVHSLYRRISPASLCFYKDFIDEKCRFNDANIFECEDILKHGGYIQFKQISWEKILVSITHKNNTTNRNSPDEKPNGCHYGWNEKLFKFIAELDD